MGRLGRPWRAALPILACLAQAPFLEAQEPASPTPEARIGQGDLLGLFVWKEPDLTREVNVRLDGRISVPLLGDVDAAGRTPQQLADEIRMRLSRFIESPQVTVGIRQATSARFFVLGQVGTPGAYNLIADTTIIQALALAGGFREFAKTDRIVVVRQEGPVPQVLYANFQRIQAGELGQNLPIRPGDTILVP